MNNLLGLLKLSSLHLGGKKGLVIIVGVVIVLNFQFYMFSSYTFVGNQPTEIFLEKMNLITSIG